MIRSGGSEVTERSKSRLIVGSGGERSSRLVRIALVLGLAAVSLSVATLSRGTAYADVNAAACGTSGVFSSSSPQVPVVDSCTYTASGNSLLADTFTAPSGVSSINVVAYGADGGGASDGYGLGGEVSATLQVTQSVFQVYAGGEGQGPTNQFGIGLPPKPVNQGGNGGGSGSSSGGPGGQGGTTVLAGQGVPSYAGGSGGGGGAASTVYQNGVPLITAGGGGGAGAMGGLGGEGTGVETDPGLGGTGEGAGTNGSPGFDPAYDSNPGTPGAGGIAAGSNYSATGTTGGDGTAGLQNGGSGGGGGGGGGGGYNSGEGGGGGGGADDADPAGSGGGGGGGSSWASDSASNISLVGTNPNGEGQIIISWTQPPDTPGLTASVSSSSVSVESTFTDTAVLSGGNVPTGSLTFEMFGPNDPSCSNGAVSTATVDNLSGDGSYTSGDFTPPSPGTYQLVVVYNGDANNNPVTDGCGSADQTVTANPLPQTITFSQPPVSPVLAGTTYAVSATSTSTAPVALSIDPSSESVCTLTSGTVNFVAPGSCQIDGQVGAFGNYSADQSSQTVLVGEPQSMLYVSSGGNDSGNNCSSQNSPCATISHALNEAASGATIEISGTIDDDLTVSKSVTITGASAATNSPAVINDVNSNTSVVDIDVSGVTVNLSDLTLTGGQAAGNGGGIDNQVGATVAVTDSTIINNSADSNGGGIFNGSGGTVTLDNSTLSSDTAINGSGGGIYNANGTVDVEDSTFANDDADQNGGGIYNSSTADVTDSTLTANTATGSGGGIYNVAGMDVVASTIYANSGELSALNISTTGDLYIAASLVASPSGGTTATECSGDPIDEGYNVADTTTCGLSQPTSFEAVTDQQVDDVESLGSLSSNGGPTQTIMPQSDNPVLGFIPSPETLDVGGTEVEVCPTTDQRGAPTASGAPCAVGSVQPSVLYVAEGGSDESNTCVNPATPCATLSHALDLPGAGGTTIEVSGTIHDSVTIPVSVTITGADAPAGQPAVIDNNASGGSVFYIPNAGTSVDFDDLTISDGNTPYGGGININGSGDSVRVNETTITGNRASAGGGGIQDNGSTLTVTDSTISDNGGGPGGGIYNTNGGIVSVVDSTIADNAGTSSGGGIYSNGGSISVIQSTLAGNTVNTGRNGSAIDATNSEVSFAASIVADPVGAPSGGECSNESTSMPFIDDGYNVVDDQSCELSQDSSVQATTTAEASAIERLGSLSNNGGNTETLLPLSGNPALNLITDPTTVTVDGSSVALCPTIDQRGEANLADASCDAGSVQVDPIPDLTAISPATGPAAGGTTITISGTGFVAGATQVDFAKGKAPAVAASDVKVISPTELTAITPSGKLDKKYYVTVVTPGGTSATSKTLRFEYLPAPTTTKLSPVSGPKSGQTRVTITGSDFVQGSTVDFGSVLALKVKFVSATTLTAISPPGSAGVVKVTVTTPSGTSKGNLRFTYGAH